MTCNKHHYNSRQISSNQDGPHENLRKIVLKHKESVFQKPFAPHALEAFEIAEKFAKSGHDRLILDACCGVGESSWHLARQNPDHLVIGIDKSNSRITRQTGFDPLENLLLIRADLVDFWRLAYQAGWKPQQQFLLFPNPWPKSEHLKRRWHAMPVFKTMLAIGGRLELRTNWHIYATEFGDALSCYGIQAVPEPYTPAPAITPFERKYAGSGQELWRLSCHLGKQL